VVVVHEFEELIVWLDSQTPESVPVKVVVKKQQKRFWS